MKAWKALLLLTLLLLLTISIPYPVNASTISNYKTINMTCLHSGDRQQLAIRTFLKDGVPYYLLLDPQNLTTTIAPESSVKLLKDSKTNPSNGALSRISAPPVRLQNHGLKHSISPVDGMFLTVDLCPSKRPFEKAMFEALGSIARNNGKPVPVAICISGAWLSNHDYEINWLKEQDRKGSISITWVNHSLSHYYDPTLLLERNFMLATGANQLMEILANEVAMIGKGLTPSVFFRFPGLVADEGLIKLLAKLSLIPLGADAWLAKGEEPRKGSIILVHSNGNEPPGIAKLMKLLQASKAPQFLPLSEAIVTGKGQ
jgi:hypothetical protein